MSPGGQDTRVLGIGHGHTPGWSPRYAALLNTRRVAPTRRTSLSTRSSSVVTCSFTSGRRTERPGFAARARPTTDSRRCGRWDGSWGPVDHSFARDNRRAKKQWPRSCCDPGMRWLSATDRGRIPEAVRLFDAFVTTVGDIVSRDGPNRISARARIRQRSRAGAPRCGQSARRVFESRAEKRAQRRRHMPSREWSNRAEIVRRTAGRN